MRAVTAAIFQRELETWGGSSFRPTIHGIPLHYLMIVVLATAVCHCPVFHVLQSLKCLPLQMEDGYSKAWQTSCFTASNYAVFLRLVIKFSSVLLLHRLKDILSQGCTNVPNIQAPHQCSRCQKGDMKQVQVLSTTIQNLVAWWPGGWDLFTCL